MPENPYQSPHASNQPSPSSPTASPFAPEEGDVVSTIIPYKNKASLVAYYSGVFSVLACLPLIGVLGVVLAVIAVIYGFKGLRYANEHPEARGRVHCWIGILGGLICGVLGFLMQAMMVISIITAILDAR